MATRRRPIRPVFDEARFQEALADLRRLADDDSDTTWQDALPEGPTSRWPRVNTSEWSRRWSG